MTPPQERGSNLSAYTDPWADAPAAQAEPSNPVSSESKPRPAAPASEGGKVTTTFKGGTGFDAPWIVIHSDSVQDAYDQVTGPTAGVLAALMERTQLIAQDFAGKGVSQASKPSSGGGGGGGSRQQSNAPRGAQEPPSYAPEKPGDGWEYRSGKKKNGQGTWEAWMPPRGSNEDPLWFSAN